MIDSKTMEQSVCGTEFVLTRQTRLFLWAICWRVYGLLLRILVQPVPMKTGLLSKLIE